MGTFLPLVRFWKLWVLSLSPLPSLYPFILFFPLSIYTIAALVDVLKANQGASNEETEEITCGPAVRTWRFHSWGRVRSLVRELRFL